MAEKEHWSKQHEKGKLWMRKFTLACIRILPGIVVRILAIPIGFFFWLISGPERKAIIKYLKKVRPDRKPYTLPLFLAFSITIIEKVESWAGKIRLGKIHFQDDDISTIWKELEQGKGALLVCSHLGNMEMLRAIADYGDIGVSRRVPVISIVDFKVTAGFNKMIEDANSSSMHNIISAYDIGPDTMLMLQEHVAKGGIVVIAGDRNTEGKLDRNFDIDFLGSSAQFPQGPFIIASLLECPTYFVFAARQKPLSVSAEYNMHIHKTRVKFSGSRAERKQQIRQMAEEFVSYLEKYCNKYPLQWYNFYEYWEKGEL
jgi:predicted LPLAT superfamily acyltransferase